MRPAEPTIEQAAKGLRDELQEAENGIACAVKLQGPQPGLLIYAVGEAATFLLKQAQQYEKAQDAREQPEPQDASSHEQSPELPES